MDGVAKSVPIEGFDQITRRLGSLGTCNGRFVGVCGEKRDRRLRAIADDLRRVYPVSVALQTDVHQHQIGTGLGGLGNGLIGELRRADPLEPKSGQGLLDVSGHDGLVFDDENSLLRHQTFPGRRSPRNPTESISSTGGKPTPSSDTCKVTNSIG